jgi:hypothetical protein
MILQTPGFVFEFPDQSEPDRPARISEPRTGTVFDLADGGAPPTFWRLELRDAFGYERLVDGAGILPRAEPAAGTADFRLVWRHVPIPQGGSLSAEVTGRLEPGSGLLLLEARWRLESERFAIWNACLPFWPALKPAGYAPDAWHLALPLETGELVRSPCHAERLKENPFREQFGGEPDSWRTWPSSGSSLQMSAVLAPRACLYLAAHDTAGFRKRTFFTPAPGGEALVVRMEHEPPLAGAGVRDYALPYPIALGAFPGGWYAAATAYRDWVKTAPWSAPHARRPLTPWFRDTVLWWQVWLHEDADLPRLAEELVESARRFPVPSAIHLYGWHQHPFDTLYPDYVPARPGVREWIGAVQAAGLRVMPYINGRICDPNSRVGRAAEPWAVQDAGRMLPLRRRTYRVEHWPARQRLWPMCPATAFWQDAMADVCAAIVRELGVDAIYLDQLTCAPALRCLAENHGHLPGSGNFWFRGADTLMTRVRQACARVRPSMAFTSEGNAEFLAHQFDGLLVWGAIADDAIPMFSVVHSRHAIPFGYIFTPDDIARRTPFAERVAREALWGHQFGWFGNETRQALLRPEHEPAARMLLEAAATRQAMLPFFLEGDLLDPALITYPGRGPRYVPGRLCAEDGAVHAAAWRLDSGRTAVILANVSAEPQTGRLKADFPGSAVGRCRDSAEWPCRFADGWIEYRLPAFSVVGCL